MNNTLSKVLIFAAGAAVGSAVSWKLLKTKYEQIAREEIESVKEVFSRREEPVKEKTEEPEPGTVAEFIEKKPAAVSKYAAKLEEERIAYSKILEESEYVESEEFKAGGIKDPYPIEPEEFGEMDDYDEVSLVYFADGVLTDDKYELIDDVDAIVGEDFADHIGDYEDECVHIRNDARRTDYEILADSRNYFGDVHKSPHRQWEA